MLNGDRQCYLKAARQIDIPVLFLNGEWDEYTSAEDARVFEQHVAKSSFGTIQATGHFLDMEHKAACRDSRQALMKFLKPEQHASRIRYQQGQTHHAFAV
ncbi:MAG: Rhamnosyltransferase 1 subunit A [Pseudomonas sp.]|nr:MAG: Rhamnosyltransferase 1 subunit A [Pseudomonas sp.]